MAVRWHYHCHRVGVIAAGGDAHGVGVASGNAGRERMAVTAHCLDADPRPGSSNADTRQRRVCVAPAQVVITAILRAAFAVFRLAHVPVVMPWIIDAMAMAWIVHTMAMAAIGCCTAAMGVITGACAAGDMAMATRCTRRCSSGAHCWRSCDRHRRRVTVRCHRPSTVAAHDAAADTAAQVSAANPLTSQIGQLHTRRITRAIQGAERSSQGGVSRFRDQAAIAHQPTTWR